MCNHVDFCTTFLGTLQNKYFRIPEALISNTPKRVSEVYAWSRREDKRENISKDKKPTSKLNSQIATPKTKLTRNEE